MQKRPTEIVSLCKVLFQSVFCYVSDNMSIMVSVCLSVCLSIFISSFLCQVFASTFSPFSYLYFIKAFYKNQCFIFQFKSFFLNTEYAIGKY